MSRLINEFFAAPDDAGSGGAIEETALNKEDIINLLEADDDDTEVLDLGKPSKDDKTPKGKPASKDEDNDDDEKVDDDDDEEEKDELDELEEDLKEPDDEDLELMTPARRKDILKEYPDLFKKFPELERSYFRERKFTELLPTIEDAREAVEAKQTLDSFEAALAKGEVKDILKAVKDSDVNSFHSLVDNLMDHLREVDKDAHLHIIGNVFKTGLTNAFAEGKASGNETLKAAAHVMYQFLFGTSDYEPPQKLARVPEKNEEAERIAQERENLQRERFESVRDSLAVRLDNTLKATIDANIDPKGSMSEYVKKTAVKEAGEKVKELLKNDTRFRNILNQYWVRAAKTGYSKDAVEAIRAAYLSRARTLLPSVLKTVRNEALKGLGRKAKIGEEVEQPRKKGLTAGKSAAPSNMSGKTARERAKAIPAGMSSAQFLDQDD